MDYYVVEVSEELRGWGPFKQISRAIYFANLSPRFLVCVGDTKAVSIYPIDSFLTDKTMATKKTLIFMGYSITCFPVDADFDEIVTALPEDFALFEVDAQFPGTDDRRWTPIHYGKPDGDDDRGWFAFVPYVIAEEFQEEYVCWMLS